MSCKVFLRKSAVGIVMIILHMSQGLDVGGCRTKVKLKQLFLTLLALRPDHKVYQKRHLRWSHVILPFRMQSHAMNAFIRH